MSTKRLLSALSHESIAINNMLNVFVVVLVAVIIVTITVCVCVIAAAAAASVIFSGYFNECKKKKNNINKTPHTSIYIALRAHAISPRLFIERLWGIVSLLFFGSSVFFFIFIFFILSLILVCNI